MYKIAASAEQLTNRNFVLCFAVALSQGRRQKNFQERRGNGKNSKKDRKIALLSLFRRGEQRKKNTEKYKKGRK